MATSVNRLESQASGKLPSQTINNPKQNVSAVTLRSGKVFEEQSHQPSKRDLEKEIVKEGSMSQTDQPQETTRPQEEIKIPSPFPGCFAKSRKQEQEKEILETFRKVEVNIPLLNAIKQVPRYAKFLKELCRSKRKLNGNGKVLLGENVSAMIQKKMQGSRTNICVHEGILTMKFDGQVIKFNIYDSMKYPGNEYSIFSIDVIDSLVQKVFELNDEDSLKVALTNTISQSANKELEPNSNLQEAISGLNSLALVNKIVSYLGLPLDNAKLLPSIVHAPKLELKKLPDHLKYLFLGEGDTLPVISSNKLTPVEDERLIRILRDYKEVIGWTVAYISGISPSTCMHKILLEEGATSAKQVQRRLNSPTMEVVKKEIQKLLDAGIIYLISDNKWVSPIQVVPKKTGVTVVENSDGELVTTRAQNDWRICIYYRKLNALTRKDHFPIPFIDQMLERLAGQAYYCCLDGYSGFHQIPVAPEDQEKTTFTCPFGTFAFRRMSFGLCNAPTTFQRCMVSIFSEYVKDIIEVFMDDLYSHGDSFDSCLINLEKILKRCIESNLVLNYEKCQFMVDQGNILGHIVSAKGFEVDKAKIDVIKSLPYPKNVREVRSFLGHAGFYRRFIKDFSKTSQPLCRLLQKDVAFEFDDDCKIAFDKLKEFLTSSSIIQPPDWNLPFEIMSDASNYAVGAVLGQRVGKSAHVIYYASRTLDSAQCNYSTTKKELLAIAFALEKFRSYLLDHLSRVMIKEEPLSWKDEFPDEHLFAVQTTNPWYADLVNYLVTKTLPDDLSTAQQNKIKSDAKYYVWDDPYL
ncbi:DNA-directed DNA polymerase [Tanacetum coccineum]|uniref:DNA-directed DNA polymerase n=1 Tax=Tanacetum coccineum TaxID=301880 RepID=A0ABQ5G727_9ASTR